MTVLNLKFEGLLLQRQVKNTFRGSRLKQRTLWCWHCGGCLGSLQCSVSCGDGVMERTVQCVSPGRQDSRGCSPESKPEARKVCGNPSCECLQTHSHRTTEVRGMFCGCVAVAKPGSFQHRKTSAHIPFPAFTHLLCVSQATCLSAAWRSRASMASSRTASTASVFEGKHSRWEFVKALIHTHRIVKEVKTCLGFCFCVFFFNLCVLRKS